MKRPVPRIGRFLDVVGLLVFASGAGVYAWAWVQLRRLQEVQPRATGLEWAAVARADRLSELSRTGLWLMVAGATVAVAAAVVARLVDRTGEE